MGQIELVVKVDENVYRDCMNGYDIEIKVGDHIFTSDWATDLIRKGIPLPKGHGALKDEKDLITKVELNYLNSTKPIYVQAVKDMIRTTVSVIEAEKEGKGRGREMKREEAIRLLKTQRIYGDDLHEAFDMAIESLKHIPCYLDSPCEYQNPDIKIPYTDYIEWHPYPQEKPRESGYYLVTTDGTSNDVIDIAWFDAEMAGLLQWNKASDILAWAYLPNPYEEGAEE